ncbi:hypothetical protein [Neisseria yangbaofengii]|uniref:hypothetical protein n=1 Tax=Neisseria yangbaofengii TaxID=2709396 RepID=UPI0013EBEDF1|nr:hypothetical protein [Neisseria yangbaofengii]
MFQTALMILSGFNQQTTYYTLLCLPKSYGILDKQLWFETFAKPHGSSIKTKTAVIPDQAGITSVLNALAFEEVLQRSRFECFQFAGRLKSFIVGSF